MGLLGARAAALKWLCLLCAVLQTSCRSRGGTVSPIDSSLIFSLIEFIAERQVLKFLAAIVGVSELSSSSVRPCLRVSSDVSCIHVYVFLVRRFPLKGVCADDGIPAHGVFCLRVQGSCHSRSSVFPVPPFVMSPVSIYPVSASWL